MEYVYRFQSKITSSLKNRPPPPAVWGSYKQIVGERRHSLLTYEHHIPARGGGTPRSLNRFIFCLIFNTTLCAPTAANLVMCLTVQQLYCSDVSLLSHRWTNALWGSCNGRWDIRVLFAFANFASHFISVQIFQIDLSTLASHFIRVQIFQIHLWGDEMNSCQSCSALFYKRGTSFILKTNTTHRK